MARRTASSKPSTAASARPICSSRRDVMTSALGTDGAFSTTAAAQRSAASVSFASRSASERSIGESDVWMAPGKSGGETRITCPSLSLLARLFLPAFVPGPGAVHELAHRVRRGRHQRNDPRIVHPVRADDAHRARRVPVRGVGGAHDGEVTAPPPPGPVAPPPPPPPPPPPA